MRKRLTLGTLGKVFFHNFAVLASEFAVEVFEKAHFVFARMSGRHGSSAAPRTACIAVFPIRWLFHEERDLIVMRAS